jgi:hypothetical protein
MRQRLRERETSDAKGAASGGDKAAPLTPMGRFKSLARRLVKVPREELDEARGRDADPGRRSLTRKRRTPLGFLIPRTRKVTFNRVP